MLPTLLIVEDNSLIREDLIEIFQLNDFHVLDAADGLKGIEILDREKVDLVITDIMMPHLDGIGLLSHIRQSKDYAHLPVIILSASTNEEYMKQTSDLGIVGYIVKPFSNSALVDLVKKSLS